MDYLCSSLLLTHKHTYTHMSSISVYLSHNARTQSVFTSITHMHTNTLSLSLSLILSFSLSRSLSLSLVSTPSLSPFLSSSSSLSSSFLPCSSLFSLSSCPPFFLLIPQLVLILPFFPSHLFLLSSSSFPSTLNGWLPLSQRMTNEVSRQSDI